MKHVLSGRIFLFCFRQKTKREIIWKHTCSILCVATNVYVAFARVQCCSFPLHYTSPLPSSSFRFPHDSNAAREEKTETTFDPPFFLFFRSYFAMRNANGNTFPIKVLLISSPSFECRVTSLNIVNFFYSFPFECAAWIGCFLHPPPSKRRL